MSMVTRRTLFCDERESGDPCEMHLVGTLDQSAESLRAGARRDGWYVGTGNRAYCPEHAARHGVGRKKGSR